MTRAGTHRRRRRPVAGPPMNQAGDNEAVRAALGAPRARAIAILAALQATGKDAEHALTVEDLAPLDQFHGGRTGRHPASRQVSGRCRRTMHVLDVGRRARRTGAHAGDRVRMPRHASIDLTESYVEAGQRDHLDAGRSMTGSPPPGGRARVAVRRRRLRCGLDPEQRHEHRRQGGSVRGVPPGHPRPAGGS